MLRRFLNLFRVIVGTAGRAAFHRAAPLYFAILVAAAVIFSGHGMDAADVTGLAARSLEFRLTLWGLWLLATTPAARAILCEPSLFVLRSLPIGRLHFLLAQGALLVLVESPWIALFLRGAGVQTALGVAIAAMAAHALIVARPKTALEVSSAAALLLVIAWPIPAPLFLIVAMAALRIGMVAAWVRAPERSAGPGTPRVRGPALLALSLTYILTLRRGHGALLLRFVLLALLGAAIATLTVRNSQITDAEARSAAVLGILSAPLLLGACGLCGPALRSEQQARWLLEACGVRGGTRVLSVALAVAAWSALFGGLSALLVGWLVGGSPVLSLRLVADAATAGTLLGIVASCGMRWAQRGDKKDGDRILIMMLVSLFIVALSSWALHELVLAMWAAAAVVLLERAAAATNPGGRWLRLRQERRQGDLL